MCANGELYDYLIACQQLDEGETQRIFAQICGAVAYIHEKGIVHRDLKLENIFLDRKNNAKLGDFGFTRENDKPMLSTWCGSLSYCAPEIVRGDKYQGEAIDTWSLGIILFALLSGHLPFDEEDEGETKRMILQEKQVYPPFFSDEVKQLLDSMLSKIPEERPSVIDVLNHPFLASQNTSQLGHLEQQYVPTFTSKLERTILERLAVAGIDIEKLMSSVVDYRCDSLCGWWWLSLQRERRRERRHRNIAKRRSTDLTAEGSHLFESAGRLRSRSRSRSLGPRRPASTGPKFSDYRFPSGELVKDNDELVVSEVQDTLEQQQQQHRTTSKSPPKSFLNAFKSGTRILSREVSPEVKSSKPSLELTSTSVKVLNDNADESERAKALHHRKHGIVQTFKSWWSEQKKSHKQESPESHKSSPVLHRKVTDLKPPPISISRSEPVSPATDCSSPPRASRPAFKSRRSSQMSVSSSRNSSARPGMSRRRTNPGLQVILPTSSKFQAQEFVRSPSPSGSPFSGAKRPRPEMRRTISASSTHSSAASYRGTGKAGHSKASSTSSNSTFASTTVRSLRSPRNPLKVMPSTPPPYMIAHHGGYKERNVFDSSLAGMSAPVAFATRKKSKRGVILQSKAAQGSRRRISMNDADLNAVEEEEADGDFVDLEETETVDDSDRPRGTRSLLDLAEEREGSDEDAGRPFVGSHQRRASDR